MKLIEDRFVGASLLSFNVAGPCLEIHFSGKKGVVSVETDALIVLKESGSCEEQEFGDDVFFESRVKVVADLYSLTGSIVEKIEVDDSGFIAIVMDGETLCVAPDNDEDSDYDKDFWSIFFYDDEGFRNRVMGYDVGLGFAPLAPRPAGE